MLVMVVTNPYPQISSLAVIMNGLSAWPSFFLDRSENFFSPRISSYLKNVAVVELQLTPPPCSESIPQRVSSF